MKRCSLKTRLSGLLNRLEKLRFVIVPDWLLVQLQALPRTSEFIFATASGKAMDRVFAHRIIKKCAIKAVNLLLYNEDKNR